jgi:hypothetical protein
MKTGLLMCGSFIAGVYVTRRIINRQMNLVEEWAECSEKILINLLEEANDDDVSWPEFYETLMTEVNFLGNIFVYRNVKGV